VSSERAASFFPSLSFTFDILIPLSLLLDLGGEILCATKKKKKEKENERCCPAHFHLNLLRRCRVAAYSALLGLAS
jgi:hypothetical protein